MATRGRRQITDPTKEKNKQIPVLVTPPDKDRIDDLAEKEGIALSPLLRDILLSRLQLGRLYIPEPREVKMVPLTMEVPCGPAEDLEDLIRGVSEGEKTLIAGALAEMVTPHSFTVRTRGWSMQDTIHPERDIHDGDRLLMTPLDEYPGWVSEGDIVLAKIWYKAGTVAATLKEYKGKKLKASNPDFAGVEFGPDIEQVVIWAVARGKLQEEVVWR